MSTVMNEQLAGIALRVQQGKRVTPAEYAQLIANNKEAFFAFLIANNPGSMNDILRHRLGYTHELDFMPDVTKLQRICQVILDRNNKAEIKTIIDNFKLNTSALSPELANAIKSVFK